jgi:ubiquinone/menaquinone biosynthesis C-methylase UbiE
VRLYAELAGWFHLLTHPKDYAEEAVFTTNTFEAASLSRPQTVLELGSGGGNNASHLKSRFTMTLTDLSPEMLALSQTINPECEHIQGDMRTLRLGRTFDCVFMHDAIVYMLTHEDLHAALVTAFVHLKPGGVLHAAPDCVRETFAEETEDGGHDEDGRSLRYLAWSFDPDPSDSQYDYDFAIMLRDRDGVVRFESDHQVCGLFSRAEWHQHLKDAGFELVEVDVEDPFAGEHEIFIARRPAVA